MLAAIEDIDTIPVINAYTADLADAPTVWYAPPIVDKGIAIIARFIRWARQQGVTTMDFSLGEMDYKTGFGGRARDLYALNYPITSKGLIIFEIQKAFARIVEKVRSYPVIFGRIRYIVQLFRRIKYCIHSNN